MASSESKLVQEIAKKGDHVPERYLLKEQQRDQVGGVYTPAIHAPSAFWDHDLLIDFSLISSHNESGELAKLHSALKHWGCFHVVNHGMTTLYLHHLLHITKQFFALPLDDKLKCSISHDFFNGYGNAASHISGDTPLNWNDRLFLTVFPEDQRQLQVWPITFREILQDFSLRLKLMLQVVLKAMAHCLGLNQDTFLTQHGERASISVRFGIYPRCSQPDRVYGVHPHSDRSTITILLQDDDVPDGLHVQKDDLWFKVPVIPGALFINLGDFAEVMSNGIFKSAVHRVVTNSVRDRVSVAAFCAPHPHTQVQPLPQLISADNPRKYKNVNTETYERLFFEALAQGSRVLDVLKI